MQVCRTFTYRRLFTCGRGRLCTGAAFSYFNNSTRKTVCKVSPNIYLHARPVSSPLSQENCLLSSTRESKMIAPEPVVRFDYTAEEILKRGRECVEQGKKYFDQVASVPEKERSFLTVIVPIGKVENEVKTKTAALIFLQEVSPNKEVREASFQVREEFERFEIESTMRKDVYDAIRTVYQQVSKLDLHAEDKRLVEKLEEEFRRNGLALPEGQREQLKKHRIELSNLCIKFTKVLNEDKTTITATKEELEGMSDDFLKGLKREKAENGEEVYVLTMKYPDVFPTLKFCEVEATRKRLLISYDSRCKDNIKILEEAVKIRKRMAHLLGYETHADFRLEVKMAKSPAAVMKFLSDLRGKLTPLGKAEIEKLKALKKEHLEGKHQEYDGLLRAWDSAFYMRVLRNKEFNVDDEKIKEFFSLDNTTGGMLDLYQKVLGLKFAEVDHPDVWHADVRMFNVWDAHTDDFIGHFYLDLFPRENKYTHAACFPLQPGFSISGGGSGADNRQYPSAAMVANFSKPTDTKPSLLKFDEVTTYFHELGHVMHELCSRTKWSRFHGTATEVDFVEAPSQMLENWCWEDQVLKCLSKHYATGEPLPDELRRSLIRSKHVCDGLNNLRQIFFGLFDMNIHTSQEDSVDTTAVWHRLREEVTLIPSVPGTAPAASFGHMMGGYDAGYYGYLWSLVFSCDMFYSRFKLEGVENEKTGCDYRNCILKPGGSRDGIDSLREFLGRDPRPESFFEELGINTK